LPWFITRLGGELGCLLLLNWLKDNTSHLELDDEIFNENDNSIEYRSVLGENFDFEKVMEQPYMLHAEKVDNSALTYATGYCSMKTGLMVQNTTKCCECTMQYVYDKGGKFDDTINDHLQRGGLVEGTELAETITLHACCILQELTVNNVFMNEFSKPTTNLRTHKQILKELIFASLEISGFDMSEACIECGTLPQVLASKFINSCINILLKSLASRQTDINAVENRRKTQMNFRKNQEKAELKRKAESSTQDQASLGSDAKMPKKSNIPMTKSFAAKKMVFENV
jgi:hypothetical protein